MSRLSAMQVHQATPRRSHERRAVPGMTALQRPSPSAKPATSCFPWRTCAEPQNVLPGTDPLRSLMTAESRAVT